MDWTPAIFGLLGTVVGATASYAGAARLQRSSNREAHERELERRETDRLRKRGEVLHEWIDSMLQMASTLPPFPNDKTSPAARTNRANIALSLLLTKDEQPALDYMQGLTHALTATMDKDARMGIINQGGQELVDWHRGVGTANGLSPFAFVGYTPTGDIQVRVLDRWAFHDGAVMRPDGSGAPT
ncbi:MAG: hypothetical protein ACOH1M_06735 [Rhodoglobus sp.]